ncbi:helix-turn-helix domain-containing protein [Neobacillus mesonae]|uniref:helix-turn-helix domain-containing protein n=2 Tax=Neobacillus mesonae TaxID=1193713 RepID=UPI0009FD06F0|nr:helix-turn-helix transcriptional regulator [Neobacillus mesonae]
MMSIAKKLRMLRDKQNWSQETLSKIINMDRSTISRYETGRIIPNDETLQKFAEVYKVDKDFFKTNRGFEEPAPNPSGFMMKEGPVDPDLVMIHQLLEDQADLKKALIELHLMAPKRKAFFSHAIVNFIKLNNIHKEKM